MIRTVRHAAIVVTDMDNTLTFYRDLLGLEVVLDREQAGEFFSKLLGLADVRMRVVMLEAPDGNRVELFEFPSHPKAPREPVEMSDIGGSHVAFSVGDLDATYDLLARNGTRFHCPPQVSPDGYAKVTYCRDPDGTIVELVEILTEGPEPYAKAT